MSSNEKGQSLMELIVSLTIAILVLGSLAFAIITSLRNAQFAKNSAQATKLAQEGIERVRTGRDRNEAIINNNALGNSTDGYVASWNGNVSGRSIWSYQINGNCGDTTLSSPTFCYFKVDNQGALNYIGPNSSFPPSGAEDPLSDGKFKRVVILSDDSNFQVQKIITVMVQWSDTAGKHESKLTTILRKIN